MGNAKSGIENYEGRTAAGYDYRSIDSRLLGGVRRADQHPRTLNPCQSPHDKLSFSHHHGAALPKSHSNSDIHKIRAIGGDCRDGWDKRQPMIARFVPPRVVNDGACDKPNPHPNNGTRVKVLPTTHAHENIPDEGPYCLPWNSDPKIRLNASFVHGVESYLLSDGKNPKYLSLNLDALYHSNSGSPDLTGRTGSSWHVTDSDINRPMFRHGPRVGKVSEEWDKFSPKGSQDPRREERNCHRGKSFFFGRRRAPKSQPSPEATRPTERHLMGRGEEDTIGRRRTGAIKEIVSRIPGSSDGLANLAEAHVVSNYLTSYDSSMYRCKSGVGSFSSPSETDRTMFREVRIDKLAKGDDTEPGVGTYRGNHLFPITTCSSPFYTSDSNYASEGGTTTSDKISLSKSFVFSRNLFDENDSSHRARTTDTTDSSVRTFDDRDLGSYRRIVSPVFFNHPPSHKNGRQMSHPDLDPPQLTAPKSRDSSVPSTPGRGRDLEMRTNVTTAPRETQWKMFKKFVEPSTKRQNFGMRQVEGDDAQSNLNRDNNRNSNYLLVSDDDKLQQNPLVPTMYCNNKGKGKKVGNLLGGKGKRSQSTFSLYKLLLTSEAQESGDSQPFTKNKVNGVAYNTKINNINNDTDKLKSRSAQNLNQQVGDGHESLWKIQPQFLGVERFDRAMAASGFKRNSCSNVSPVLSEDSGRSSHSTLGDTLSSKISKQRISPLSDMLDAKRPKSLYRNQTAGKRNIVIEAYPASVDLRHDPCEGLESGAQVQATKGTKVELTASYDSGKADSVNAGEMESKEWLPVDRKKPNEDTGYSSHSEDNSEYKRTRAQHIFSANYQAEVACRFDQNLKKGAPCGIRGEGHPTRPNHLNILDPRSEFKSAKAPCAAQHLAQTRLMRQRECCLQSKSYDNIYFVRNGNWILKKGAPDPDFTGGHRKPCKTRDRHPENVPKEGRTQRASKCGHASKLAGSCCRGEGGPVEGSSDTDSCSSVTSNFITNQFSYLYNSDIYEDIDDIRAKGWNRFPAPRSAAAKYNTNNNHITNDSTSYKLNGAISVDRIPFPAHHDAFQISCHDHVINKPNNGVVPSPDLCPSASTSRYDNGRVSSKAWTDLASTMASDSGFCDEHGPSCSMHHQTPNHRYDNSASPSYVFNDVEAYIQHQRHLDKVLIQENWRNLSQPCLVRDQQRSYTDHPRAPPDSQDFSPAQVRTAITVKPGFLNHESVARPTANPMPRRQIQLANDPSSPPRIQILPVPRMIGNDRMGVRTNRADDHLPFSRCHRPIHSGMAVEDDRSYFMVPNTNYALYNRHGSPPSNKPGRSMYLEPNSPNFTHTSSLNPRNLEYYPSRDAEGRAFLRHPSFKDFNGRSSPSPNLNSHCASRGLAIFDGKCESNLESNPNHGLRILNNGGLSRQDQSPGCRAHFIKRSQNQPLRQVNNTNMTNGPEMIKNQLSSYPAIQFGGMNPYPITHQPMIPDNHRPPPVIDFIPRIKMPHTPYPRQCHNVPWEPCDNRQQRHNGLRGGPEKMSQEPNLSGFLGRRPLNNQTSEARINFAQERSTKLNSEFDRYGHPRLRNEASSSFDEFRGSADDPRSINHSDKYYIDSWSSDAFLKGIPMVPKEIRNINNKRFEEPSAPSHIRKEAEVHLSKQSYVPISQSTYSMENIEYLNDTTPKLSNNQGMMAKPNESGNRVSKIKKFQSDENLKNIIKCQELTQGGNFWKRMSWLEKSTAQKQVNMKNRPLPKEPKLKKEKEYIK